LGTGFYGSNDPTNSVKALKEVVVLKIGFNPTRSTSPCYNTTHASNNTYTRVSWSLTSLFSRNTAISETNNLVAMFNFWGRRGLY